MSESNVSARATARALACTAGFLLGMAFAFTLTGEWWGAFSSVSMSLASATLGKIAKSGVQDDDAVV